MADKIGLDISHWTGKLTDEAIQKIIAHGIRFVGVKFSQGTGYKDDVAEYNTAKLQAAGVLVFPYHFATNADSNAQYNWFVRCMGSYQFDLPPAMDCEYYTAASNEALLLARAMGQQEAEVEVVKEFRYANPPLRTRMGAVVGAYQITNDKVVNQIGLALGNGWMRSQSKLAAYRWPDIYTNLASGNAIFKRDLMAKYNLWVAAWGARQPSLPNVWKAAGRYIIWQDGVVSGAPYGITGEVDHNRWGNLFPFPGDEPPPPPSDLDYWDATLVSKDGKTILKGRITEVK